jgi:hypothetical protein
MRRLEDWFLRRFPNQDQALRWAAISLCFLAFLFCVPSLFIPLGLAPEGDAVDYRIPLVKWMIRHGTYPNLPFTMVDDYPFLGEILMASLYLVSPGLMRMVPILGYFGLGWAGGKLAQLLSGEPDQKKQRTIFWLGMLAVLSFRPITLQSNLLMVDNLASFFLVATLVMSLNQRFILAGLFCACALATRYTTWGMGAFFLLVIFSISLRQKNWKTFLGFVVVAGFGALPFMIRNYLLNGNPFFPIGSTEVMKSIAVDTYGRGTDISSFLLLPYDLLITNSFVNGIFDYTVGKLFYLQVFAVIFVFIFGKLERVKKSWLVWAFCLTQTLIWFFSGQQLRFWVPTLVVLVLILVLSIRRSPLILWLLTLVSIFSFLSVQKDSILIAMGKKESFFADAVKRAENCFLVAEVGNAPVGYITREGMLGFFDQDFYFLPPHSYAIPSTETDKVNYIYALTPREGFQPWPKASPCLLKRISIENSSST